MKFCPKSLSTSIVETKMDWEQSKEVLQKKKRTEQGNSLSDQNPQIKEEQTNSKGQSLKDLLLWKNISIT